MEIYLKKEFLQFTGSFKERGARNALLHLTPGKLLTEEINSLFDVLKYFLTEQKKTGVVSASLGNHALGKRQP